MYSPNAWTKWVLIPFWALHIIFLIAFIGALAYLMLDYGGTHDTLPRCVLTAIPKFHFLLVAY